jgi:rRNA maturation endonuclease Nob1
VQKVYARLTGVVGFDPEHILKHRISALGPPCVKCGKPLRTPEARKCASCGHSRAA